MKHSQEEQIFDHLLMGRKITPLEALNLFGCFRLGARIFGLRKKQFQIESDIITLPNGKHVAQYWMTQEEIERITLATQEATSQLDGALMQG